MLWGGVRGTRVGEGGEWVSVGGGGISLLILSLYILHEMSNPACSPLTFTSIILQKNHRLHQPAIPPPTNLSLCHQLDFPRDPLPHPPAKCTS